MQNILFIDDDINRITSTIEMIKLEGFEVNEIDSADDAIAEIKKNLNKYDLIILDIMMPSSKFDKQKTDYGRITGIFILNEIRKINEDIPVIILSVLKHVKFIDITKILGVHKEVNKVNEYIEKPEKPSKIIETIKDILKTKE